MPIGPARIFAIRFYSDVRCAEEGHRDNKNRYEAGTYTDLEKIVCQINCM